MDGDGIDYGPLRTLALGVLLLIAAGVFVRAVEDPSDPRAVLRTLGGIVLVGVVLVIAKARTAFWKLSPRQEGALALLVGTAAFAALTAFGPADGGTAGNSAPVAAVGAAVLFGIGQLIEPRASSDRRLLWGLGLAVGCLAAVVWLSDPALWNGFRGPILAFLLGGVVGLLGVERRLADWEFERSGRDE